MKVVVRGRFWGWRRLLMLLRMRHLMHGVLVMGRLRLRAFERDRLRGLLFLAGYVLIVQSQEVLGFFGSLSTVGHPHIATCVLLLQGGHLLREFQGADSLIAFGDGPLGGRRHGRLLL
jgi:hypothetical protein